jgi:hypothetical protein
MQAQFTALPCPSMTPYQGKTLFCKILFTFYFAALLMIGARRMGEQNARGYFTA